MGRTTELIPLKSTRFSSISHTAETGSTNADLLALAKSNPAPGVVLVADHQTAGRGRQNRSWHDAPGDALLVSVLLNTDRNLCPVIPFAVGMAAVDTVDQLAISLAQDQGAQDEVAQDQARFGQLVGLKWPNDVLAPGFGERKLAGILAESHPHPSENAKLAVVAGMGLNLRWSEAPPEEVLGQAVTLEEIIDGPVERNDVLYAYLGHLERWLTALEDEGPQRLMAEYRKYCLTLGRGVRFVTATGDVSGVADGVADSGALQIRVEADGRLVEVVAGDAHHLEV